MNQQVLDGGAAWVRDTYLSTRYIDMGGISK